MATVEFGDFTCTEFGGFTDHTSAIPPNESCSILLPSSGSIKSFNSALSQSFNPDEINHSIPEDVRDELMGKFVFNSIVEQGFSQNQISKLAGMCVHQGFITHLSLTDENMPNMENLSVPSLTSLSFFPEKTDSFELELSVAKEGTLEIENSNFLLDLSFPSMKEEAKNEEPNKNLMLDEELLSLNFGGLETLDEKTNSECSSQETSSKEFDKLERSLEIERVEISKDTEAIIQSLPDLSYLLSRVLVFPIDKKLSM